MLLCCIAPVCAGDVTKAPAAHDEKDCGSGPFERCGFFYDVVPWWHLITPFFVVFVVMPLLAWSLTKRGAWSGWHALAKKYALDAWPRDASDLGVPSFCRLRRRDGCAPQKFDQQLRVAAAPTALCLRVECCANGLRPLAVLWPAVRDGGDKSMCSMRLGQLVLDEEVLVMLDGAIYSEVLAAKSRSTLVL